MKTRLLLVTAAMLVGAVAWAQLRITSFNSSGELTWTNFARVGAYRVEWANSPTGSWHSFATATNLNSIWVETNRVTVRASLSNSPAFYRVAYLPPDPVGEWDYRGYDKQGTLVVTGKLTITRTLLASNPPIYSFTGWRDIRYAGPPTNYYGNLVHQIGTGGCSVWLEPYYASLSLGWPTNCFDCTAGLGGTLWPNSYTGSWTIGDIGYSPGGTFSAERR